MELYVYQTRRLSIRKFELRDLYALADLFGSEAVMWYIGPRRAMGIDETKRWLDDQMRRQREGLTRFAVELTGIDELVGVCGFLKMGGLWDFGYYFRERYWGRGYATEACSCLLARANELLGNESFRIFVAGTNLPSQKVLKRCGYIQYAAAIMDGEQGSYYRAAR